MRTAHELARNVPRLPSAQRSRFLAVHMLRRSKKTWRENYSALVEVFRTAVIPGGEVTWSAIRRTLALAGMARAPKADVVMALAEVAPEAYTVRPVAGGPRMVRGIRLRVNPDALQGLLAAKWEVMLVEAGMAAEPTLTPMDHKLSPARKMRATPESDITGHGCAGTLATMVKRVHERKQDMTNYLSLAEDYLWHNGWSRFPAGHKEIWRLHCQGMTKREIAKAVGKAGGGTSVQRVLDKHRARAGLIR